jgi:hypothetical protein
VIYDYGLTAAGGGRQPAVGVNFGQAAAWSWQPTAWRGVSRPDSGLLAQQYQHSAAMSGELAKEKTGRRTAAFGRETKDARATTP